MRPGFAEGIAVVIAAAMGGIGTWAVYDWFHLEGTLWEGEEHHLRLFVGLTIATVFFFSVRVILYRYFVV